MPPRHPGSAAALLIGGYFELDWVSPVVEDVSVDVVVEDEVVELELVDHEPVGSAAVEMRYVPRSA